MKILIYGINYSPELTGIGKYTGKMAPWLASHGHEVRVITAPPYYPEWRISAGYFGRRYCTEVINGVTVFRTPIWVPVKPKTISRLLHLATFAISSLPKLMSQIAWRPDVIICIAPSFFCAPATILFSTLSKSRSWLHVQDFEIDAMFGLGLMGKGGLVGKFAFGVERFLMQRFDRVSSISHSMCNCLKSKGVKEQAIILFPNCVDTDFITPQADRNRFKTEWGFRSSDKIVLYSGNLGKKQGLEIVLEAATALREISGLHFVIVGDGAHKSVLIDAVQKNAMQNIHFYPLQPQHLLPDLLRMADIHLVIQKRGAADAVMPSKLTGILSVGGNAIITAEPDTELGCLVNDNPGIATLIEPENSVALETAIRELIKKSEDVNSDHNQIARKYAVEKIGKDSVLGEFEKELSAVLSS